jgi:hypothetical protein
VTDRRPSAPGLPDRRVELARAQLARLIGPDLLDALDEYLAALEEGHDRDGASGLRFLDVAAAAARMGCSEAAMRKRIARRRVPVHRQGGRVYVDVDELDRSFRPDGDVLG